MSRPIFSSQAVKLKGGKPVIYLFAPNVMDAASFSKRNRSQGAIPLNGRFPSTRTEPSRTAGLDVAYLFWEALTNHDVPMTPRDPRPSILLNLSSHNLIPDSVLLPVNTITPYFNEALRELGLYTELRTSFITCASVTDIVAGEWKKAAGDPARWRDVVALGVDVGRAGDAGLLRILEWRGMEVVGR
ncbi:hypothetical protein C8R44DRAFT_887038 [Mycena epipterygia]|nr:hypothetical protein C8R44DRAFT_887038 [Mycena epipterygia]